MSKIDWENFCQERLGLGNHEHFINRWWTFIHDHMQFSSIRPYHNLVHVEELLQLNRKFGGRNIFVELAIWFHDVIYDTHIGGNEQNSAEVFTKFALEASDLVTQEWCSNSERVLDIKNWILETSHHTTSEYISAFDQPAFHFFLDFDMSILGADQKKYQDYAKAIRIEYSHVLLEEFMKKRTEFLLGILDIARK